MPAFYPQRPLANQLPLTPPDSGSAYNYNSMPYVQDQYAQHQNMNQARPESHYDYPGYMQPPVAPAPPTYHNFQAANSLPPIQSYYEPMGAPILPPLRIHDQVSFTDDYQRRLQEQQSAAAREQQRQASKEEKATGGVSAKLDYDMERMTDFVTDKTQKIFRHSMQNPPSFRKWVHQVLSATRLPCATILLSLHYLNERVLNFPETVSTSENQIYRLLAVALVLGSKFLDDNTFINRSWSDVTAIKVTELNVLEVKWLELLGWHLHVDPESPTGLKAWFNEWEEFKTQNAAKQLPARLSPLNTNVHRNSGHRERFSPYPTPYTAASSRPYEAPQSARSSQYACTPYTAADPWASTERQAFDEFFKSQNRYPTLSEIDDVNRRASEERARQSAAYAYPQIALPSYYQPPAYTSAWDQQSWSAGHRYDCGCAACAYQHQYRPYPMTSSYSAQTVMG